MDHDTASTPPTFFLLFHKQNGITILSANIGLETELQNSIKIYGDKQAIERITYLVNKYFLIWEFSGLV